MWIKHNNAIYNTSYISRIDARKTKLYAIFEDGEEILIGSFKSMKQCNEILSNITKALLFESPDNPGIIIKDTR